MYIVGALPVACPVRDISPVTPAPIAHRLHRSLVPARAALPFPRMPVSTRRTPAGGESSRGPAAHPSTEPDIAHGRSLRHPGADGSVKGGRDP